jgi:hypothetical protein
VLRIERGALFWPKDSPAIAAQQTIAFYTKHGDVMASATPLRRVFDCKVRIAAGA